jgi:cyclophilin family peptidyl-prolyl cis-trans isomerase
MHASRITRTLLVLTALLPVVVAAGQETRPAAPPAESKPPEKLVHVLMTTSLGEIVLELNHEKAPITVENFLAYAEDKFYDETIFHRVIRDRIIQGGGFEMGLIEKKPRPPITNEWPNGLQNKSGTIAMARKPSPNSATSQFYINVADNLALDRPISGGAGYAVFGRVVAGMDVVDRIQKVPTGLKKGMRNVPIETVLITEVRPITAEDARTRIGAENKGPTTKPAG